MSQVTIYKDADVALTVVDGTAPVDQTALVASLQQSLLNAKAAYDALAAKVAKAQADLA